MGKTAILSVRIVSDADNKGFKKAAQDANKFGKDSDKLSAKLGKFAKSFAAIGAKSTAITGAVAAAGGVIGNLGLGIVALGAVAGPALGAVALGFDGIKEAAQKAAPAFSEMKEAVSGAFADTMGPGFEAIGELASELTGEMTGLGEAVGTVLGGALEHIATVGGPAMRDLILASTEFTSQIGPGINALIDGFLSLGPAILPVADQLSLIHI